MVEYFLLLIQEVGNQIFEKNNLLTQDFCKIYLILLYISQNTCRLNIIHIHIALARVTYIVHILKYCVLLILYS